MISFSFDLRLRKYHVSTLKKFWAPAGVAALGVDADAVAFTDSGSVDECLFIHIYKGKERVMDTCSCRQLSGLGVGQVSWYRSIQKGLLSLPQFVGAFSHSHGGFLWWWAWWPRCSLVTMWLEVTQVHPVCQLWLPQPLWEAPSWGGGFTAACVTG